MASSPFVFLIEHSDFCLKNRHGNSKKQQRKQLHYNHGQAEGDDD